MTQKFSIPRRDLVTRQLPDADRAADKIATQLLIERTFAFIDKRARERAGV